VATPPPAEVKDPSKEFTPPPAVEVPVQPAQVEVRPPGRPRAEPPKMPTDVDYNALIKRDGEGKLLPVTEPVHIAAMRVNTKLPSGFVDTLTEYLADRKLRISHLLVANLDIVEQIDQGIFEQPSSQDDKEAINKLMNTLRPIVQAPAPRSITEELRDRKVMEQTQWLVNNQIVRNYTLAGGPAIDRNAPKDVQGDAAWRAILQLYKSMTDEYTFLAKQAHEAMANQGDTVFSAELVKALTEKGLSADTLAKARELITKAVKAGTGTPDYTAAMKAFREATTLDQRKLMYEAALKPSAK
jgi:hypothetical protein